MFGEEGGAALGVHTNVNWGGRMINRSTPLPISPPMGPQGFRVHLEEQQARSLSQLRGFDEEDHGMEEEEEDIIVDDDVELELEGLEWKLELDDDHSNAAQQRERPTNPLARQMEQAGSRCSSAQPTPRSKDLPHSKRSRFASGSGDLSTDSNKGHEIRRLFHDGSPECLRSGTVPPTMTYPPQAHGTSPVPVPDRSRQGLSSAPPSPCPVPQHSRYATSTAMVSPPISPSTTAFPRYYSGGPLMRVDTPKTNTSCGTTANSAPVATSATLGGAESPYLTGSPPVPMGWRSNVGSTPPSIFYARPPDAPRGGGVSPLREVIRNWGISS